MPLISVIVPVYKVEKYINRCVDSILNQTLKNFELILIDDGSPDNCGRLCDEYAEKDKRIRVIHQENGGLSAARNTGINWASEYSDSEWLTFIDSDDWVHEQYLELLYNAVDSTGCNVSMCGFQETEGAVQKVTNKSTEIECWETEPLFCTYAKNATVAWGKMYRKSYFETINYPVGEIHEDEFVTYRILFQNSKIARIEAPLYYYFCNATGITHSSWGPKRLAVLKAFEEQIVFFRKNQYYEAYANQIRTYIRIIVSQMRQIKDSSVKNKRKYLRKLKWKLKKRLFLYKKQIEFKENAGIYELAYPVFMWIYWTVKAKINISCK